MIADNKKRIIFIASVFSKICTWWNVIAQFYEICVEGAYKESCKYYKDSKYFDETNQNVVAKF